MLYPNDSAYVSACHASRDATAAYFAADAAWQAELVATYGKAKARDYRYMAAFNRATDRLAALHDELQTARDEYRRQHDAYWCERRRCDADETERQRRIDAIRARRAARGDADPLNRLSFHLQRMKGDGAPAYVNMPAAD